MARWLWIALCAAGSTALVVAAGSVSQAADAPAAAQAVDGPAGAAHNGLAAADWLLERVELRGGRRFEGLVESDDGRWLEMVEIRRPSGRPMHLVIRLIERRAVERIERLDPVEHSRLRERIEQFINRAPIEASRMQAVALDTVTRGQTHYLRYRGKWFEMESTADEPATRRIIVRMEQMFAAFRQILPPKAGSRPLRPLRVTVYDSMEGYREHLARLGASVPAQACFLARANEVVAGSRLREFAAQLAGLNAEIEQCAAELDRLEGSLPDRLRRSAERMKAQGLSRDQISRALLAARREFEEEIERQRNALDRAERASAKLLADAAGQTFTRLYHEAFHAYLENYVYPQDRYLVPLWLNEGLAQIFEAGRLEADTLRIDAPNAQALERLKKDLRGARPLALGELLSARPQAFLGPPDSERYYDYAWGLAYYLTFERQVLGTAALDAYVAPGGAGPVERFEKLVGMPLDRFEPQWRNYVLCLE